MLNRKNKDGIESETDKEITEIYSQVKDTASNIYEEGKKKAEDVQKYFGSHTDELIKTVKEKPLVSVLVAAGIGFILSSLIKK